MESEDGEDLSKCWNVGAWHERKRLGGRKRFNTESAEEAHRGHGDCEKKRNSEYRQNLFDCVVGGESGEGLDV